ncbi:WW domain-binding protein 4 [Aphidius gifuensis]|uniref:WW domain-binding protein 4 n=1 Tax=Aphidius gifuensis TaxID=684658 RepID=UPI001CDC6515|nr:WW domain-binding protein 4 [Aphidius gifuensis]
MADYWKSQGRKFCDFCKCWTADNKPSIEFHENGKKHKENVEKRLKEIHKNSAKQMKITKKYESDIKNMENAAMAAYLKDLEGNQMDLTAQQLVRDKKKRIEQSSFVDTNPNQMPMTPLETNPRHKSSKNLPGGIDFCDPSSFQRVQARESRQQISASNETNNKTPGTKKNDKKIKEDDQPKSYMQKLWYEAKSPEGWTYYWHTETHERKWEIPVEGYMSIAEQEEEVKEQALQLKLLDQLEKEELIEKADIIEEQRANAERERLKEFRKNKVNTGRNKTGDGVSQETTKQDDHQEEEEEEEEEKIPYRRDYSVPDRVDPYGPWKIVEIKPKKVINLQLPEQRKVIEVKPKQAAPVPVRIFKEKVVTKIHSDDSDDEGSSTPVFKKRKFGNKNTRKRLDDDE